jgi:hypothetical protein
MIQQTEQFIHVKDLSPYDIKPTSTKSHFPPEKLAAMLVLLILGS